MFTNGPDKLKCCFFDENRIALTGKFEKKSFQDLFNSVFMGSKKLKIDPLPDIFFRKHLGLRSVLR